MLEKAPKWGENLPMTRSKLSNENGSWKEEATQSCHSPETPTCLSVHMQRSISQKARCCAGEIEAEGSSSRAGLGCPHNWWTRGNISFAWWLFHLATQFATSEPPTTHTQKTHLKLCKKEQPRRKERRSKHTRIPHCFLCHRPSLCVACSQITTCFEDGALLREANYKNMVWLGNGEMVPNHSKVGCQVPCSFQCVY